MNSRNYVLSHDYGYGKGIQANEIKKLHLRNLADLRVYVNDVLENAFGKEENVVVQYK